MLAELYKALVGSGYAGSYYEFLVSMGELVMSRPCLRAEVEFDGRRYAFTMEELKNELEANKGAAETPRN